MKTLYVKKTHPDAALPIRATDGSAGADLCARLDNPLTLWPGQSASISTGVAIEIEPGWVGLVFGRSGLGIKHNITLANSVGVIDSDYRGEVMVGLINHGEKSYEIQPGERIAQLVLVPAPAAAIVEVDELSNTARGSGGFGSTGTGQICAGDTNIPVNTMVKIISPDADFDGLVGRITHPFPGIAVPGVKYVAGLQLSPGSGFKGDVINVTWEDKILPL